MPLLPASTPSQHASNANPNAHGDDPAPPSDRSSATPIPSRPSPGSSRETTAATPEQETENRWSAHPRNRVTRVAVIDDHAAVRIGLRSAIGAESRLECVGVASDGAETGPLLYRTRPDVVILDYQLPPTNGLALCRQIKSDNPAPAVVLYSAYAGPALLVPAIVAGADAIVHKAAPPRELFEAIRVVAGGGTHLPPLIPELLGAASAALEMDDLPIVGMLLARTRPREIAATLGLTAGELDRRVDRMLAQLHASVAPSTRSGHSQRDAGKPGPARRNIARRA
jgi:DNA-binding NarL/FixJ family response regulator